MILLAGGAVLKFEDAAGEVRLAPGDHLYIARRRRHRVEWTTPDEPTVWLALHFTAEASARPGA